jgi:hypothetical protein
VRYTGKESNSQSKYNYMHFVKKDTYEVAVIVGCDCDVLSVAYKQCFRPTITPGNVPYPDM